MNHHTNRNNFSPNTAHLSKRTKTIFTKKFLSANEKSDEKTKNNSNQREMREKIEETKMKRNRTWNTKKDVTLSKHEYQLRKSLLLVQAAALRKGKLLEDSAHAHNTSHFFDSYKKGVVKGSLIIKTLNKMRTFRAFFTNDLHLNLQWERWRLSLATGYLKTFQFCYRF